MSTRCVHCGRPIVFDERDGWIDPCADGDDTIWRETCDEHDTFIADHEPEPAVGDRVTWSAPPIDRHVLVETPVTLDGKPARITGARLDFAVVRTRDGKQSAEWAWPTVARIVANGGRFQS